MADEPRIPAWTPEWFGFTDNGMKWLADQGLQWIKVCADPGDLIVWDSRIPHYNVPTQTQQDRFAIYTCFMPVRDASQEDLERKKEAFESKYFLGPHSWFFIVGMSVQHVYVRMDANLRLSERLGTTHWPNARHVAETNVAMRDGKPDLCSRERPIEEPQLNERTFKLTGIPYIQARA